MKHDYAKALEDLAKLKQSYKTDAYYSLICNFILNYEDTFKHALMMMQKLQEPSETMIDEIMKNEPYCKYTDERSIRLLRRAFRLESKAMIEQAEKEVENVCLDNR